MEILLLALLLSTGYVEAKKQNEPLRMKCGPYVLPSEDTPLLIYYELHGNTTVHYAWSLKDTPALFMSVTGPSSECTPLKVINDTIIWSSFPDPGSAPLPGHNGTHAFTIVFNRLIEFCDKDDGAQKSFHTDELDNPSKYRNYSLNDFDWTFDSKKGVASGSDSLGLKWDIQINVPTEGGRLKYFPKTLYTENSTTFDFAFQNFTYKISTLSEGVQCGRLVLDLILVHGQLKNGSIMSHFSRDDEYTPSIFLTYNYLFGEVGTKMQSFLQWKPISYLSPQRKSTKSEQINAVPGPPDEEVSIPLSLAGALFNQTSPGNVTQMYLVMGTQGDDNNYNPNYVTWTGLLGFGDIPYDQISIVVITTIIVGLGVPLVLIVLGALYVVIKKKPWEKFTKKEKGYSPVNNDTDDE